MHNATDLFTVKLTCIQQYDTKGLCRSRNTV